MLYTRIKKQYIYYYITIIYRYHSIKKQVNFPQK